MKFKLHLPYSHKEFERLVQYRKLEIDRYNNIFDEAQKKQKLEDILNIVDKLYEYINIQSYNKYARNTCKFSNSEETSEVCEKRFTNTLQNYTANGNCCKSCNSAMINNLKSANHELQN